MELSVDDPALHPELRRWVGLLAEHLRPDRIHWCDGGDDERRMLEQAAVDAGSLIALDPEHCPGSFLHRSHPTDVARTEHLTYICTRKPEEVGPTNQWMSAESAVARVWPLFAGAMRGRTLYVVPYLLGPAHSTLSQVGVQVTDSPYVALSLRTMTRMGRAALDHLGAETDFVRGVHSLGDLSPNRRFVVHFPDSLEIWSVGTGYGGNAILSKKSHALRLASVRGRNEGWMAEHMAVLGLTSPEGETHYVAAAFPSGCGKSDLAMLAPSLPGWTVDTVGDDICWMHPGGDGRLWAINPENGMFGSAAAADFRRNPNLAPLLSHDVLFTNVARRKGRRVWWEGQGPLETGEVVEDWRGEPWTLGASRAAAHPNARFAVPLRQCPTASGTFDDPAGVPISAILFGGRCPHTAPLVYEARSWAHGVYVGATMVSETTAAAAGEVGVLRHDPMAMLPFCGMNMADYFAHWLAMGSRLTQAPRIFHVNWFRRDAEGGLLWPGFGENIRVLDWVLRRVGGSAPARTTPIGYVPTFESLDLHGLGLSPTRIDQLLRVDVGEWIAEARKSREFLDEFGPRLPDALLREHRALRERLQAATH